MAVSLIISTTSGPSTDLPSESQTPALSLRGMTALCVADRCGITLAIHKCNSEDVQWREIGSNLIAYWAGDGGSIQCYFDAVTKKFPSTERLRFQDLIDLNEDSDDILPLDEWTSDPVTVNVRDRHRMVISKTRISMTHVTEASAALGTGGPAALKALSNCSGITSCELFDTNEKLQQHVVFKAIAEAIIKTEGTSTQGYCEIIRGCPDNQWKVVREINVEDLLHNYGTPGITSYV